MLVVDIGSCLCESGGMKNGCIARDKIGKCHYVIEVGKGSSIITMTGYNLKNQTLHRHLYKLQESGHYAGWPDQRDSANMKTVLVAMQRDMARVDRMMKAFKVNGVSGIHPVLPRRPMSASVPKTTRTKSTRKNPLDDLRSRV